MDLPLLLGSLGPGEILLLVLALVLLFGASKVPELARSLGRAKGEFQKGLDEGEREANEAARDEDDEEEKETAEVA